MVRQLLSWYVFSVLLKLRYNECLKICKKNALSMESYLAKILYFIY